MNALDFTRIEDEAAAWLVRLDSKQVTADERAVFEQWLQAHPRHRVAFLRLQVAWRRVDKLAALGAFESKRKWSQEPIFVAVAAVLLAGIGLAVAFSLGVLGARVYITEVGNSGRFVLQDGSTMILNTDTKVRVSLTSDHRHIVLIRGEAYFQVAPEAERPFEVRAGDTNIRALGTAFSVRLSEHERVEVLVSQGRVAVRPSAQALSQPAVLVAGESAIVIAEELHRTKVAALDIPRKLAWQDGLLRFNGETLAEAVAEFNRYNRRQLVVADPAIADRHIGGGFQTTDLDSFIKALERSFRVRAEFRDREDFIALHGNSN